MTSFSEPKLFPNKLPPNFHGPVKSKRFRASVHHKRIKQNNQTQPQLNVLQNRVMRLTAWQRGRSDHQVNTINKQYIEHVSRSSIDNPQMFKNTLQFYNRSYHKYPSRRDRNKYTVFGQKKDIDYSSTKFNLSSMKFGDVKPITLTWTTPNLRRSSKASINSDLSSCSSHYLKPKQHSVTQKIGSKQRIFDIKPPTVLKIGHFSYVDSYNIK